MGESAAGMVILQINGPSYRSIKHVNTVDRRNAFGHPEASQSRWLSTNDPLTLLGE